MFSQHKTPAKKQESKTSTKKGKGSQEKKSPPNSLDEKFSPDKNSVFNIKNSSGSGNESSQPDCANIIKFNPALLIRKTAAVFYERRFNDAISLQGGLGFCYGIDPLNRIASIAGDMMLQYSGTSAISYGTMLEVGKNSGLGLFLSAGPRFQYTSWYFESNNSYIEFNYRFNSNKISLVDYANSNVNNFIISGSREVITRSSWFNIIWGTRFTTDGKIKTSHEFYYGMGIRKSTYDLFTSSPLTSNNYNTKYIYSPTGERGSVFNFSFLLGYAFGIGFN